MSYKGRDHRQVLAAMGGRPLPPGAVWARIGGDLVICQDKSMQMLLTHRVRAFRESGNTNYRQCFVCRRWDEPSKLMASQARKARAHPDCSRKYHREYNREYNARMQRAIYGDARDTPPSKSKQVRRRRLVPTVFGVSTPHCCTESARRAYAETGTEPIAGDSFSCRFCSRTITMSTT